MQSVAIILCSIIAAITYGIIRDQVTARICVEYFTIGHPPVFHTEDPTLLALGWGIYATWWVGLLLGIPLAFAARAGSRPKRSVQILVKPILLLMGASAIVATLAGVTGWVLAQNRVISLAGWLAEAIPPEKHSAFIADLWTHLASYGAGIIGGLILIARVRSSRKADQPELDASQQQ